MLVREPSPTPAAYHALMFRTAAVGIGCAVAFGAPCGIAGATPNVPPPPPPPCSFSLSAPIAAGSAVTATVQSTGCAPLAVPYTSVVCLEAGGQRPFCAQAQGMDPAQVVVPYQPGVAYTATGRGCARWIGQDPAPDCQLLGPATAAP